VLSFGEEKKHSEFMDLAQMIEMPLIVKKRVGQTDAAPIDQEQKQSTEEKKEDSSSPSSSSSSSSSSSTSSADGKEDGSDDSKEDDSKSDSKKKPGKPGSKSQQEQMKNKKQRELQERKERADKEKADKERQEEEERIRLEEATKYVKLAVRRFHTLESNASLVQMYYRSKLIQGIKWISKDELSSTGAWGDYVPTPAFLNAVEEIIKRHVNKEWMKQNHKSSLSSIILDESGLKSFLSYGKLGDKEAYRNEISVLQKHASLASGVGVSEIIQFFGKLVGANQTIYDSDKPTHAKAPYGPLMLAAVQMCTTGY